jgi:hypothetical protein
MQKQHLYLFPLLILIVLGVMVLFQPSVDVREELGIAEDAPTNSIEALFESDRTIQETDGVLHSIPLEDIQGGGPQKDGIPSLDNPQFISVSAADDFLDDGGLGIAISYDGVDRFYPMQIMVWHEIVNDHIGDQAFLVTYCPLCGTGIVYEPIVNGEVSEFGTSGKLWNSNLVMYDRQTDSYWSQALGEAVVGEMTGTKLTLLPYQNMYWEFWKKQFPEGEVLSKDTGYSRDYDRDPYGDYYTSTGVWFELDNEDSRYHQKEPMWGIEIEGVYKAYVLEELLQSEGAFQDTVGDVAVNIQFDEASNTFSLERLDTGESINASYSFWFSWISIHTNTEVFTPE